MSSFSRNAHPDSEVEHLITQLLDALVHWERVTGRSSVFILREGDVHVRAMDGKPNVPPDLSDAELFFSSEAINSAPM